MSSNNNIDKDFLTRLTEIIHEHIDNEMFGVSELAGEIGMSRSNLLRKVKKLTNLSVSQFIREYRLERSLILLQTEDHSVSEVAYQVGFGSATYFSKSFSDSPWNIHNYRSLMSSQQCLNLLSNSLP